ncbi:hypothetical protein V1509DRAFT_627886 [Lipomyces kononenkoae]
MVLRLLGQAYPTNMGPPKAILVPALGLTLIISFVVFLHSFATIDSSSFGILSSAAKNDTVATEVDLKSSAHQKALAERAHNSTLGFGEILYISMPERSDRQDAMTLLSTTFGIRIKHFAGVRGSEMSPKAMPDGVAKKTLPSEIGCWRAHANAWRYLLESDMDTLLIFEDDLDWNVNLKQTMELLSLQMQNSKIRQTEPSDYERANAPYGLDWDVLDIGSCKDSGHPNFTDVFQVWDDPDVAGLEVIKRTKMIYESLQNFGLTDDDIGKKRLLAPAYLTVCTSAYAITRQGAERLLMEMSYIEFRNAVDTDMSRAFRDGRVRGYMLTPPAISQFRIGGAKDTDNRKPGDPRLGNSINGKGNLHGFSANLKDSARQWMVEKMQLNNWDDYKQVREERKTIVISDDTSA